MSRKADIEGQFDSLNYQNIQRCITEILGYELRGRYTLYTDSTDIKPRYSMR